MWDKDLPILHSQHHGCWWPGDARSQGISNHDIYCVGLSWLLMTLWRKEPGHQQPWYLLCWPVMAADDLATQGARASATMIFTMLNRINFIPTGEWLSCTCMHTLKTYLFYIVNIMAADDLAMQGAKASATMISTVLDCHGCWWLCDARSQGISNHDIYYVDLSWLLMTLQRKEPGHQQPWYSLCWTGLILSPQVNG